MTDSADQHGPGFATNDGRDDSPPPMGVEHLLEVLRSAVARLPRDTSPVIRDEAQS